MKLTAVLVLINIVIFFLTSVFGLDYREFGFKPSSFLEGRFYIVVTSMFLHANLPHLFFNMIALFLLGTSLEKKVEKKKYLLTYFLGGIVGNLVMLIPFLYDPDTIGVGASGAISALVGLGTFLCPGKLVIFPSILPLPFVVAGALYFLSTAVNLFVPSQIGYPVHMTGMIIGSVLGLTWSRNWRRGILIFVLTLILIISLPYILAWIFL
jgi:membrane associated rhomboid family serine protease